MLKYSAKCTAVALALVMLPGVANAAGSSAGSGTAALIVGDQCSLTGATVDLGTFTTSQKWSDVSDSLGLLDSFNVYKVGSRGQEYLNFGTVTCPATVNYTLNIKGSGVGFATSAIKLVVGSQTVGLIHAIKRLGNSAKAVTDTNNLLPGVGAVLVGGSLSGTGTGTPQSLFGSATVTMANSPGLVLSTALGTATQASDSLAYTLTF
ncbi:MAG: hypothetical protein RLZZ427_923 [Pseudomonadota bacterium]|jgi:hypothetical protein